MGAVRRKWDSVMSEAGVVAVVCKNLYAKAMQYGYVFKCDFKVANMPFVYYFCPIILVVWSAGKIYRDFWSGLTPR